MEIKVKNIISIAHDEDYGNKSNLIFRVDGNELLQIVVDREDKPEFVIPLT